MSTTLVNHARRGGLLLRIVFVAASQSQALLAMAAIVTLLLAAWGCAHAGGGSHTAWPHAFYVPVMLAAVRFSWIGAALAAVAAGVLAGPFLPADVSLGTVQPTQGWLMRLVAFTVIGSFVATLMRHRAAPASAALQDSLLSARLIRAIQLGHIEVHYQPIYDVSEGRVSGVEALARWHDPRRGGLSPAQFVPAAERTGAIAALDGYVLRVATAQAERWGRELPHPLTVSVNVSATHFAGPDLLDDVGRVLDRTGLPAQRLQLEITESALLDDVAAAARQIGRLRDLGVKVAIDDFGVGQASLSYLDQFRVDTIKLDRSLISESGHRTRDPRLLTGIVDLLDRLGLTIVAEGIESAEQCAALHGAGVGYGQGFHFARPAPATEIHGLLVRATERAGGALRTGDHRAHGE